jgi:adenylate cyclase class IV
MSSLIQAQRKQNLDEEIEVSSKEQTEMLVLSLYFSAWGKITKTHKLSNKNIKYRVKIL